MNQEEIFLYESLTPYDQITFAKSIQVSLQLLGRDSCWCLKENSDSIFYGFNRSKAERLLYKGRDARPLILAIAGLFQTELKPVIVRRSFCTSKHCLNPSHYYWGSRGDVALKELIAVLILT